MKLIKVTVLAFITLSLANCKQETKAHHDHEHEHHDHNSENNGRYSNQPLGRNSLWFRSPKEVTMT